MIPADTDPLQPGFAPVRNGHVATIVTHLEMTRPPDLGVPDAPAELARHTEDVDAYRRLFRRVGEDWLWVSRLVMPDTDLTAILQHPEVDVFVVQQAGQDIGLLELDFREAPSAELAFFGLVPEVAGQGLGRWLMAQALSRAWARPISKLSLHTCTLDSPVALPFYLRSGFKPVRREVEVISDPRLSGVIRRGAAPHIPIIEG